MKQFTFSLTLGHAFNDYLIDLERNDLLLLEEGDCLKVYYVLEIDNAQLRSPLLIFSSEDKEWTLFNKSDHIAQQQSSQDPHMKFASSSPSVDPSRTIVDQDNFVEATTFEISRKLLSSCDDQGMLLKIWAYVVLDSYLDPLLVATGSTFLPLNSLPRGTHLVPTKLMPPMSFKDAALNDLVSFEDFAVPITVNIQRTSFRTRNLSSGEQLTFDHFTVESALGKGSFGEVLLVRERSTNRPFALKTMAKGRSRNSAGIPRILEEVRVLKPTLESSRCRNGQSFLIQLKYSFQSKTHAYFVTNAVLGGSLQQFLRKEVGYFDEPDACFYAIQIIFALQYMHKYHIIHRDLKLENILLDVNGYAKICDFGLSSVGDQMRKSFCGTVLYMAPEIFLQQTDGYTNSVDWWAFGVLLFELVTGKLPFRDQSSILNDTVAIPSHVSKELSGVIRNLLCRDYTKRLSFDCPGSSIEMNILHHISPFDAMEIEGIFHQKVVPPFVPSISHNFDSKNFEASTRRVSIPRLQLQAYVDWESEKQASTMSNNNNHHQIPGFDYYALRESMASTPTPTTPSQSLSKILNNTPIKRRAANLSHELFLKSKAEKTSLSELINSPNLSSAGQSKSLDGRFSWVKFESSSKNSLDSSENNKILSTSSPHTGHACARPISNLNEQLGLSPHASPPPARLSDFKARSKENILDSTDSYIDLEIDVSESPLLHQQTSIEQKNCSSFQSSSLEEEFEFPCTTSELALRVPNSSPAVLSSDLRSPRASLGSVLV